MIHLCQMMAQVEILLKQLGGFQTPSKNLKNRGFLLKKYLKNFYRNFRNSTQRYQNSAKNQSRQSDECEKYCFSNKMIVKKMVVCIDFIWWNRKKIVILSRNYNLTKELINFH